MFAFGCFLSRGVRDVEAFPILRRIMETLLGSSHPLLAKYYLSPTSMGERFLVGWLVGWLIGWSVGMLAGSLLVISKGAGSGSLDMAVGEMLCLSC